MNSQNFQIDLSKLTHEQQSMLVKQFNKFNTENTIKNFSEQIIQKENQKICKYVKFLESKNLNALIYGPTQLGKTNAAKNFIETSFKHHIPVIVSTDNKSDQKE